MGARPGVERRGRAARSEWQALLELELQRLHLGDFFFGKVNGQQGRLLPQTKVCRALWKARNAAQDDLLAAAAAAAYTETAASKDDELLDSLFDGDGRAGREGADPHRKKASKPRTRKCFENLPPALTVTVASAQEGVSQVTFEVLRAMPECLPAIALTAESLSTFLKEIEAEMAAAADESTEPTTPTRRRGKRRTHPLADSPGQASPKRIRRGKSIEVHYDKKGQRVTARWRTEGGEWGHEIWKVQDPADPSEVTRLRLVARSHAKRCHVPENRKESSR